MKNLSGKKCFGNLASSEILILICDSDELENMDKEYEILCSFTGKRDWALIALGVSSWFDCLSPWEAPPVFGKQGFGNGAGQTLEEILEIIRPYKEEDKVLHICGYSLAGLFALWASTKSAVFSGVCAASPSVWFPSFLSYVKENPLLSSNVYLSLGDTEEKTKNPFMATVGKCIKELEELLKKEGKNCFFESNSGNHFKDADLRIAKGMAYLLSLNLS
ncbi:MAG: hypothetical protein K6F82_06745 [Sphaerochaetaceae bacterium]|nr:hypothetical protein [Sphaerochaetaceae bacterium]